MGEVDTKDFNHLTYLFTPSSEAFISTLPSNRISVFYECTKKIKDIQKGEL